MADVLFDVRIQLRKDIRRRGKTALQHRINFRELACRFQHHAGRGDVRNDRTRIHAVHDARLEHQHHQQRYRQSGKSLHHLRCTGFGDDHLHILVQVVLADRVEPVALVLLTAKGAHHAMPRHCLSSNLRDISHGILNSSTDASKASPGEPHHPDNSRCDDEEHQRQLPVFEEQVTGETDHHRTFLQQGLRCICRSIANLRDVERNARHEMTLCAAIEERAGQLQQPLEQRATQLVHDAVRNARQRQIANRGA